jgi:hypothetical protein
MTTLGQLPLNVEFVMDSYDFARGRSVRHFGRVIGRKGIRQGHAVRCVIADEEGKARTRFLHPDVKVHALGFLAPPADAVRFLGISRAARGSEPAEHVLHAPFPAGQRRIA